VSARPLSRRLLGGRARRWLLLVLSAGLAWRILRYALVFPMWGDEAFVAVNVLLRDFAGMLAPLEHDMVAPVGFLWAEVAARMALGSGEAALRLVPFLAGLAAFVLFARLARERLSAAAALVSTAILAASYYPVRHAAEVKPYALDLLVAVPIVAIALRILEDGATFRRWLALTLVSAAAVWFSWTAIFVAGGVWLALVPLARTSGGGAPASRSWIPWLVGGALVLGSFVRVYLLVGSGQQWSESTTETSGQWSDHFPPLSKPWLLPLWLVQELTGPMLAYPNGGRLYGAAGTLLFVVLGVVSLARRGRGRTAALLLSPLVPMFVAAALRKYPFGGSARTTLHLAVPVCLLAGEGLVATFSRFLSTRGTVLAARAAATVLAMAALVGAVVDVKHPWKKRGDAVVRDAVTALADVSGPSDRWVVFGDFAKRPDVPDLRPWGGSAARLRYQLLRRSRETGAALFWGTPPAFERSSAGDRTFLLTYRDDEVAFPEERWAAFLEATTGRLGASAILLDAVTGEGKESLTILRFPP